MVIYKITNKLNGKCYIGQTIDINRRLKQHFNTTSKHNKSILKDAIKKHGKDNFTMSIIGEYKSLQQLNDAEEYFIQFHNCLAPNGYCGHTGGNSHKVSDETRKKQSETRLGKKYGPRNIVWIPWNTGKRGLPNNGGFQKGHKGCVKALRQPVLCYNGTIYSSLTEAAKALGTSTGKISAVLKGTRKHTKGFTFKKVACL